jgi:hypothetical protein
MATDFQTCHDRCRGRTCVFPLPLIDAMAKNEGSRVGAGWSATTILQCPLQTILKEEEDYYESPADYHARWRGTGVHAMAEVGGPYEGVIQGRRIRKFVYVGDEPVMVTGKPDWFDARYNHLDDWKSTKKCPSAPYDDHIAQVNIYAWLIDGGMWDGGADSYGVPFPQFKSTDVVETASIIYIDPDRSVIRAVELWTTEATEAMIQRKLEPLVRYRQTGELPAGIRDSGPDSWKRRFCPFKGTGKCCADREATNGNGTEEK